MPFICTSVTLEFCDVCVEMTWCEGGDMKVMVGSGVTSMDYGIKTRQMLHKLLLHSFSFFYNYHVKEQVFGSVKEGVCVTILLK
jgi:hypothetical protein